MSLELNQLENLKQAMPTKREEAWKYTSLTEFKKIPWVGSTEATELTHDHMQLISQNLPAEFYNLVFVNGKFNATLSDDLTAQISIINLSASDVEIDPENVEKNVLKFANLFLKDKLQINISAKQIFEKPLQIVFVGHSEKPLFISKKVDINVEEKAQVDILIQTLSLDLENRTAINLNVNLNLQRGAVVKLIQIENQNPKSFAFVQSDVQLQNDSNLQSFAMTLGGQLSRNYLHVEFLGAHADAEVNGLNALSLNQHADHYTFIQHTKGDNQSRQLYKSILSDSSHSVFRGRVRIEKDAQKANSSQLNNNLLLTREAQADSIPQLEIYADDVKAGHGSTVGQLNKDEIFYFLSRGINQYEAVKMLSFGYAQELIYKFENKLIQEWLLKNLNRKLDRMIQNV